MHIYKGVLSYQIVLEILECLAPDTKKPPAVLEAFAGTLAANGLPRARRQRHHGPRKGERLAPIVRRPVVDVAISGNLPT
jgi:hypothetical protein